MLVTMTIIVITDRAGERGAGAERRLHREWGSPEHHHHHHYRDISDYDFRPEHPGEESPGPRLLAAHAKVGGPRSVHQAAVLLVNTERRKKDNKTKLFKAPTLLSIMTLCMKTAEHSLKTALCNWQIDGHTHRHKLFISITKAPVGAKKSFNK